MIYTHDRLQSDGLYITYMFLHSVSINYLKPLDLAWRASINYLSTFHQDRTCQSWCKEWKDSNWFKTTLH